MLISAEVLTLLILNSIILFFSFIVLFISLKISFFWDFSSTNPKQYKLEKQAFLASTIIKYILILKIALFAFFVFVLDKISNVIVGAMCAAGVVDATSVGIYLLLFKLLNIYLFGFWLIIHKSDLKHKTLKFTKAKFIYFIFIFILLLTEIIIEFIMFANIEIDKLVSCCGTLYSTSQGSYISSLFTIDNFISLSFFYGLAFLLFIAYLLKNSYIYAIVNVFFLILSLATLVTFFGTYIYEIPTHHCPFCMLQREYNYIGYLVYLLLFSGTFYGFATFIYGVLLKENNLSKNSMNKAIIFTILYVILVSYFVLNYYFKHGVFL